MSKDGGQYVCARASKSVMYMIEARQIYRYSFLVILNTIYIYIYKRHVKMGRGEILTSTCATFIKCGREYFSRTACCSPPGARSNIWCISRMQTCNASCL